MLKQATRMPALLGTDDDHAALRQQSLLRWEELATANRRKDEFLAVLGHELRGPLASLQNAFQLLSRRAEDSAVRRRTQALIERQLRHITRLVDDLVDVSRIVHGNLRLNRERIDLCVVVRNAVETPSKRSSLGSASAITC
jgi:signal transduction histidine kinase